MTNNIMGSSSAFTRLLLLFTIHFSLSTSQAQPDPDYQRLTISGQLLDADLKEPMVQATSRSDTQYNSVNSYAMLHVRYRLNIFGGNWRR